MQRERARMQANAKVKPSCKWLVSKETGAIIPATEHNWPNPANHGNPHLMPFNSTLKLPLTQPEGQAWLSGGDSAVLRMRAEAAPVAEEAE